jgi:hypothetical protein
VIFFEKQIFRTLQNDSTFFQVWRFSGNTKKFSILVFFRLFIKKTNQIRIHEKKKRKKKRHLEEFAQKIEFVLYSIFFEPIQNSREKEMFGPFSE